MWARRASSTGSAKTSSIGTTRPPSASTSRSRGLRSQASPTASRSGTRQDRRNSSASLLRTIGAHRLSSLRLTWQTSRPWDTPVAGRRPKGERAGFQLRLPGWDKEGSAVRARLRAHGDGRRPAGQRDAGRVLVSFGQNRGEREGLLLPGRRPGVRAVGAAGTGAEGRPESPDRGRGLHQHRDGGALCCVPGRCQRQQSRVLLGGISGAPGQSGADGASLTRRQRCSVCPRDVCPLLPCLAAGFLVCTTGTVGTRGGQTHPPSCFLQTPSSTPLPQRQACGLDRTGGNRPAPHLLEAASHQGPSLLSCDPRGCHLHTVSTGAITAWTVSPSSITSWTVSPSSITSWTISPGSITSWTISPSSITALTISPSSITSWTISPGSITSRTISPSSVTSGSVSSWAVTPNAFTSGPIPGIGRWPGLEQVPQQGGP
ncbi:ras-related protein Rab-36 isoform X1 [Antechinus flavipes]|uniref:ras-related protein Rab-36 isoform X1 n=1 Tax=Antechinus flavipes TaxID=38775 RepID=UPI002235A4F2|nr:ras-related protein Rab-36 isoform X1 [Antechinus flavipes]XP_051829350.1 ras-related protein Rab-36 isoform X1 [Antechinus flavipes]